jgi:hypothetical protein
MLVNEILDSRIDIRARIRARQMALPRTSRQPEPKSVSQSQLCSESTLRGKIVLASEEHIPLQQFHLGREKQLVGSIKHPLDCFVAEPEPVTIDGLKEPLNISNIGDERLASLTPNYLHECVSIRFHRKYGLGSIHDHADVHGASLVHPVGPDDLEDIASALSQSRKLRLGFRDFRDTLLSKRRMKGLACFVALNSPRDNCCDDNAANGEQSLVDQGENNLLIEGQVHGESSKRRPRQYVESSGASASAQSLGWPSVWEMMSDQRQMSADLRPDDRLPVVVGEDRAQQTWAFLRRRFGCGQHTPDAGSARASKVRSSIECVIRVARSSAVEVEHHVRVGATMPLLETIFIDAVTEPLKPLCVESLVRSHLKLARRTPDEMEEPTMLWRGRNLRTEVIPAQRVFANVVVENVRRDPKNAGIVRIASKKIAATSRIGRVQRHQCRRSPDTKSFAMPIFDYVPRGQQEERLVNAEDDAAAQQLRHLAAFPLKDRQHCAAQPRCVRIELFDGRRAHRRNIAMAGR